MSNAVDHEAAASANALTAIVFERDRRLPFGDELFVDHVKHFEERHVGADILRFVALHTARGCGVRLPPDVESEVSLITPLGGWTYSNSSVSL